ncbi:MAG: uridine kinase, partial [Oscillospiraceae bacterium]
MPEWNEILTAHAVRYPLMRPKDAVKLLYQQEFGGGHLIADPDDSLRRLCAEYDSLPHDPAAPLLEDIGSGLVRVMLTALPVGAYPLEELNEAFVRSAQLHTGSRAAFLQKLELLKELTRRGVFPFSPEALEEYLGRYIASGCPAVSHSPEYRAAYRPAYRVVLRSCLPAWLDAAARILREIAQRKAPDRPFLVALDGRCASGKTTLAARLQAACGCGVVHLDDFFLRPEQRTKERYATPGENIDHERFLAEVLLPLRRGEAAVYRPYDCARQALGDPVRVEPSPVVVAEGSYACHSALW